MLPLVTSTAGRRALLAALALLVSGCERAAVQRERVAVAPSPLALSVRALDDTGSFQRLEVRPPREARAWLTSVAPVPASKVSQPVRPRSLPIPLPEPEPDTLIPPAVLPVRSAPVLEVDPGLKAPVLVRPARLDLPPAGARGKRSIEFDVRVSETGEVTDVLPAGASGDPALVAAARECVLRMRFLPALRGGERVAVWCRQRFDFGPARP